MPYKDKHKDKIDKKIEAKQKLKKKAIVKKVKPESKLTNKKGNAKAGAPIGNKNAIGNKGGKKPLFDDVISLQKKIDDYFEFGAEEREFIIRSGRDYQKVKIKVHTITGLSYFLGFESRQSFYDYEKNIEFSYTIKRARLRMERIYEENLQYGNTTGAIFALKNMDWKDKTETDITTGGENINKLDLSGINTETLINIANCKTNTSKK